MLSVEDCLAAIGLHTRGLAEAAAGNLDLRIEHCPDWSMADLVWHLTSVHWFWNQVAVMRPTNAPEDLVRPGRPADAELVPALLTGVAVLTDTLRAADQQAPCWTWGLDQSVWFITRHQVQEAAVHHWDAANAVGAPWSMDDAVAIDAVDEFLTQSVANSRWPAPEAEPLGDPLVIGLGSSLVTISDGAQPGTLTHHVSIGTAAANSPGSVLLWLYRRLPDDQIDGMPSDAATRFRAFTSTD